MPEINLLSGQSKQAHAPWLVVIGGITKVLWVVAILVGVSWAYLFFMNGQQEKKIVTAQAETSTTYDSLANSPDRKELVTRQGQLKAYSTLSKAQPHWSSFFTSKLAPATLKSSKYVSVNAQNNGTLRLMVSVPTYTDLDKFLQVFDQPDLNKVFSDIKVTSLAKGQNENVVDIRFEVTMKYNPEAALAKVAGATVPPAVAPEQTPTTSNFTR